jgi:hypothetical protein
MGYPPDWQRQRYEIAVKKWVNDHPDFPWIKQFTEEEKNNWVLSIPNNGPQPGVLWDGYNLLKFTAELDAALRELKTEMPVTPLGRIRAIARPAATNSMNQAVVLEVLVSGQWVEVWSQPWNGTEFTQQYAMSDIPKNLLIESQMIDPAFIERYSWANTPFNERYKELITKTGGTCAWVFMTLATETKGVVVTGADISPKINEKGVLTGYDVSLKVADKKAGYIVRYTWGDPMIVGPDGKIIK